MMLLLLLVFLLLLPSLFFLIFFFFDLDCVEMITVCVPGQRYMDWTQDWSLRPIWQCVALDHELTASYSYVIQLCQTHEEKHADQCRGPAPIRCFDLVTSNFKMSFILVRTVPTEWWCELNSGLGPHLGPCQSERMERSQWGPCRWSHV